MTKTLVGATIRPAAPGDLENVQQLLAASSLPLDGVSEALSGFVVAEQDDRIVGVAGVEDCGDYGLLRSVAVDRAARNNGVGRQLVERSIQGARTKGMKALYLLTTTAEGYFPAFGFKQTTRDAVPEAVRRTTEFRFACPASATVMRLELE